MTEADILALTYEDTVTVYRPFKDRLPNGETVFHRKAEEGRFMNPSPALCPPIREEL